MKEYEIFELGYCYEVILENETAIQFRVLGGKPLEVESPINSNRKVLFDVLFTTYKEIHKITCPKANSKL